MSTATVYNIKTYNILYPYSKNNFNYLPAMGQDLNQREPLIIQNITEGNGSCSRSELDVFCLQEISPSFFSKIQTILKGYQGFKTLHQQPHHDGVAIFFNSKTFNLLEVKTHSRSTTLLKDIFITVQDRNTALVSRIAVVHIAGGPNRTIGDTQLKEILQDLETAPSNKPIDQIILAGDFNDDLVNIPGQSPERHNLLKGYQRHLTLGDEYDATGLERKRAISHVAVKCLKRTLDLQMYPDATFTCVNRKGSDHAPVTVTLNIIDRYHQGRALTQASNSSYMLACAVALVGIYAFYSTYF